MARETRNAVLSRDVGPCSDSESSATRPIVSSWSGSWPPTMSRPRRPSRFWLSAMARWCSTFAGKCSTIHTTPRTPFRPPFWYCCAARGRSASATRSQAGSSASPCAWHGRRDMQRSRGGFMSNTPASWRQPPLLQPTDNPPAAWRLHEEIARLPDRYREPIVLCHLEGLSTAAAAQRLGCAQGTILSRLARGRERLRQRLSQQGQVLSPWDCSLALPDTSKQTDGRIAGRAGEFHRSASRRKPWRAARLWPRPSRLPFPH